MENFRLNSIRAYIGKNVNLHLKDGAVIVNVQLKGILKTDSSKNSWIEYGACGKQDTKCVPLKNISWAERLNPLLMQATGIECA